MVAHSVRAASLAEIKALHAEAARRGLPFHMHVEEQRREIEETVAAYGRTPMRLLCDELAEGGNLTAVHCTHTSPRDMDLFLSRGGRVCVCPLTEANLGDGIPDLSAPHAIGGRLSLGTDSNARISAIEEMRWLEYGQRLRGELRGALMDPQGGVAATTAGGGDRRRRRGARDRERPDRAGRVGRFRRGRSDRAVAAGGLPGGPAGRDRFRGRERRDRGDLRRGEVAPERLTRPRSGR